MGNPLLNIFLFIAKSDYKEQFNLKIQQRCKNSTSNLKKTLYFFVLKPILIKGKCGVMKNHERYAE